MIPRPFIAKWQEHAPWREFAQVEQDLIISRTLVEVFSDDFLRENLAFRGGTALHKLYLSPAPRYSEDIDLVQIKPGPIKPIIQRIGEVITFFEEERRTENRGHGSVNVDEIIHCFTKYIEFATGKRAPTQKEFLLNIEGKATDPNFIGDMEGLLRPEIKFDGAAAFDWLKANVIQKM